MDAARRFYVPVSKVMLPLNGCWPARFRSVRYTASPIRVLCRGRVRLNAPAFNRVDTRLTQIITSSAGREPADVQDSSHYQG
jgi:hypothetical protein